MRTTHVMYFNFIEYQDRLIEGHEREKNRAAGVLAPALAINVPFRGRLSGEPDKACA
jgi:hypothetical protein